MMLRKRKCVLSDNPANTRRHPVPGPAGVKLATEAPEEIGHQVSEGRNVTGEYKHTKSKTSLRAHHRIGTWNTNGILHPGKLTIVDKERENHRISILGISETHLRGQGHFKTTTGSTLYFSGKDDSSRNGVGILLPAGMSKFVLGYNPVSDRIISLKLNTKPCLLNIVQIYAPTAQSSDEDINEFYGNLEKTLDAIPSRQITIILGDWNAKVGNFEPDYTIRDTIGRYGLGTTNERGQRLIEFCVGRKLSIMNTHFKHHLRRLYTWRSPGDRYRNQIDYVMINARWKSSIKNVKTFPGADCGSDHVLLVACLSLRLKAINKHSRPTLRALNSTERAHFQSTIEGRLTQSSTPPGADADALWKSLECKIKESLSEIVSKREKDHKRTAWITDHTWELIQRRKEVKVRGLQNADVLKEYSNICRAIKNNCRLDKNNFITNICREVETHALKQQTSDLFKKVRLLSRQFKPKSWVIEDTDGKPLHELDKIAERWRGYCEDLYKTPNTSDFSRVDWSNLELEPNILRSEVVAAITSLKAKKAPGPDQITAEILRALGDKGFDTLHNICNHIWRYGEWPSAWTQSIILPLHKKGSTKKCDNYRTLALISHASKILLQIINNRIRYYLDWQIPQEQAGFVKGKGTREQILNVKQIVEKCYEFDLPVIICFVDYSKAFDCVNWDCLWRVLLELGVPHHLTALLQSLYYNSQGMVRVGDITSKPFSFEKGVRQGCILSPILFNIYGEYIIRRTCDSWNGGITVGGRKICNLRYADDTTLFAASEAEMITVLERMERISTELGLSINRSKTKIMVIDRTGKLELTGKLDLEVVDNFIYLGSSISCNGSCEHEIRRRIGMAKGAMAQLQKIWKNRSISLKTKTNLVRTLVFSIFSYGAETWTLKKADRDRIDAFEMWCWRKMLGIPWTAHRSNVSILQELNITTRLSTICLRRILEYFGHIARKNDDNLERLVVTGKVEGKRPRGRSPTRWTDQIRTALDTTVHEALHSAADRDRWRRVVRNKLLQHGGGHDPQH